MNSYKTIIVDDERLAREEVKRALSNYPEYTVVGEASNAYDAIKLIEKEHPDLLFLDIHMPEMDGIEATRTIQSQIENPPPIVIMSADVFKKENHKDSKIYISDFVLKPFKSSDIRDIFIKYKIIN